MKNYIDTSKVIITNIQRFSLHDGPGIRTTVFLKGCSLRCPWCSNPENFVSEPQQYIKNDLLGIYGKYYSSDELYNEVIKDKDFYNLSDSVDKNKDKNLDSMPGGVTFSGGEPLLQIDKLEPLLKKLKQDGINMSIETSLYASEKLLDIAIQYIDLFYVDIKILDSDKCENILNGDLDLYLSNLNRLFKSEASIVMRIPVISGWTDDGENIKNILRLLKEYHPLKVELIKEHNLGVNKYESLNIPVPDYRGVSDDLMKRYYLEVAQLGINVEICKI